MLPKVLKVTIIRVYHGLQNKLRIISLASRGDARSSLDQHRKENQGFFPVLRSVFIAVAVLHQQAGKENLLLLRSVGMVGEAVMEAGAEVGVVEMGTMTRRKTRFYH